MMKLRMIFAAGALALLSACNVGSGLKVGLDPAQATERITKLEERYQAVKSFADMIMPFLPITISAKIELAERVFEKAIAVAKVASTTAEQLKALHDAEQATEQIAALGAT